ncbi:MAG: RNA 2',3'-cyclic phosphodiesterase [Spirochaetes bacterium]|nr:RNA 2',3'-cyclic phosphodiesterase [Spirochaetota bacterium]
MRTFLAFEVEEGVKEKILNLTDHFRGIDRGVRWIRPENSHVTIHFFGEVDEENIPELEGIIRDATQGISPFTIEIRGISAFPSLERARVIWYGTRIHEQLNAVYNNVRDGLKGRGIVEKLETRPYTPHLTAGRVKGRIKPRLVDEIRHHEKEEFGSFTVGILVLFKSTLTATGPHYKKLALFNL